MDYQKLFDECDGDMDLFYHTAQDFYDDQERMFRKLGEKHGYTLGLQTCAAMKDQMVAKEKYNKSSSMSLIRAIVMFKEYIPMMMTVAEAFSEMEKWEKVQSIISKLTTQDMMDIELAKETEVEKVLRDGNIVTSRGRCKCPICKSKNPTSFSCRGNRFRCFKCGEMGDTIEFAMKLNGTNFMETINYLKSL